MIKGDKGVLYNALNSAFSSFKEMIRTIKDTLIFLALNKTENRSSAWF